ncbi:MAG TPA: M48 family metalloprotease [Terriglobia bacterium]|nr:M48 family metalloprotease [Terriglobia bacterium]
MEWVAEKEGAATRPMADYGSGFCDPAGRSGGNASTRPSPKPRRTPQLFAWALLIGLLSWPPLAGARWKIVEWRANDLAPQVMQRLLSTPLGKTLPQVHWKLILVNDPRLSASSDGAGTIYLTTGLAECLGQMDGAWAFVLGHEIGHALIFHSENWRDFEAELQKAGQRAESPSGAGKIRLPFSVSSTDGNLLNVNRAKQREYAADYIGMMLMAAAGYHPEFVVLLDDWFSGTSLDVPRVSEFFESHPRWKNRKQFALKNYDLALAVFNSRGSAWTPGPGQAALPASQLGRVVVTQLGPEPKVLIKVPVRISKPGAVPLQVTAVFMDRWNMVQSAHPQHRSANGTLVLSESLFGDNARFSEVSFQVPVSQLATRSRKLKLVVFLRAGEQTLSMASTPVLIE